MISRHYCLTRVLSQRLDISKTAAEVLIDEAVRLLTTLENYKLNVVAEEDEDVVKVALAIGRNVGGD